MLTCAVAERLNGERAERFIQPLRGLPSCCALQVLLPGGLPARARMGRSR